MPPAARVGDLHTCPMMVGGPVMPSGQPNVLIGFLPAARVSDRAVCAGAPDVIVSGAMNVLIGNLPAARMGDATACGGIVTCGYPTVMIGTMGQSEVLLDAAEHGTPFCEECPQAGPPAPK